MIFGRRYLALVSIKRSNVNRFRVGPILDIDASAIFQTKIISVHFMPSHFEPLSFDDCYWSFYTCQRTSEETEHVRAMLRVSANPILNLKRPIRNRLN